MRLSLLQACLFLSGLGKATAWEAVIKEPLSGVKSER
jgi:hypothetical protein